ncbi:DUF1758 domain-containing protein [Trichonephila clavipes]|nr:DUF1758 domain-containing protein [Trichonephila clavipes]
MSKKEKSLHEKVKNFFGRRDTTPINFEGLRAVPYIVTPEVFKDISSENNVSHRIRSLKDLYEHVYTKKLAEFHVEAICLHIQDLLNVNQSTETRHIVFQFYCGLIHGQAETEGEERINLAMTGFGLFVDKNCQSFKKKVRFSNEKDTFSSANLLITASKEVKKECVFCTGKHSSRDCFQAQKMNFAERLNILRGKQSCFACLTPKHTARSCKTYLKCIICGKKHIPLMCESLRAKNQDSYRSENKGPKVEVNMANNTSSPRVFLQTLKLKMVCGNKEIPIRAILLWVAKVLCIKKCS